MFKCHVIYYGVSVTSESKYLDQVADMSKQFGFVYEIDSAYTSNTPNFIVRAGKDAFNLIPATIDEYVNLLLEKNIPFELINYPNGQHSFDLFNNNEESVNVILRTLDYLESTFKY